MERICGLDPNLLVESHGTFHVATCVGPRIIHDDFESESHNHALYKASQLPGCGKSYSNDFITKHVNKDVIPICESCSGIVKPNITFFHESLPTRFYDCLNDFNSCDALIIMGTSLQVNPFAGLVDSVHNDVPRLLINRENCGHIFDFESGSDACYLGSCDDGVDMFMTEMGWKFETNLIEIIHEKNEETKSMPIVKETCNLVEANTKITLNNKDELESQKIVKLASECLVEQTAVELDDDNAQDDVEVILESLNKVKL